MKSPARRIRPIKMKARRKLNGDDCIIDKPSLFLTEQLIEKLLQELIIDSAAVRIGLPLRVEDRGGRLRNVIGSAECDILFDQRIHLGWIVLHQSADLRHFSRG